MPDDLYYSQTATYLDTWYKAYNGFRDAADKIKKAIIEVINGNYRDFGLSAQLRDGDFGVSRDLWITWCGLTHRTVFTVEPQANLPQRLPGSYDGRIRVYPLPRTKDDIPKHILEEKFDASSNVGDTSRRFTAENYAGVFVTQLLAAISERPLVFPIVDDAGEMSPGSISPKS